MPLTLIVFELNILQKKLINLLEIKALKEIFLEYRHMIQKCVDIFVLTFVLDFIAEIKERELMSKNLVNILLHFIILINI